MAVAFRNDEHDLRYAYTSITGVDGLHLRRSQDVAIQQRQHGFKKIPSPEKALALSIIKKCTTSFTRVPSFFADREIAFCAPFL